jgi:hypothetical protein
MNQSTTDHPQAERFARLFESHPNVYGRTEVAEGFNEEGKRNSRSWLKKEALTTQVWSGHLNGAQSIGCVPIRPNNMVSWGAIDVDVYEGRFDFEGLRKKITDHSLPFVVCRSKSGGGHIYLFLQRETLAKNMVAKLEAFAAFFGQGASEIFPKQTSLGSDRNDTDFGNWINMPYDGPQSLRYAQDDAGAALSMEEFLNYAEVRKLAPGAFNDLAPPHTGEILPDGPPCLNYIFSERAQENDLRNITLANVCVYLKKAYGPEEWTSQLNRINELFGEPLPDRELDALKKSYSRNDYRYQCSKQPLCSYCDSRKCKQKRHGVGGDEIVPSNRSLTKLATEPPLWYLTVDDKRIALTTDQLFNFSLFNKRCLEVLNKVFQPYKQSEWLENLASIASACTIIEVPEEMTAQGALGEMLEDWLTEYSSPESPEVLDRGVAWKTTESFIFRQKDLQDYLERKRFKELTRNQIIGVLRDKYEAEKHTQHFNKTSRACWRIKRELFSDRQELTPTEPDISDAF